MSLRVTIPESTDNKPKILVLGVGGAGGNAVNNMINAELQGVEFWVANTDSQALEGSLAQNKIQLGPESTRGLGAGSYPDIGEKAAEESISQIKDAIQGCNMVFIATGMGGGTGTGAAPVIARCAKESNILTVGVITKPFQFEGAKRMRIAEEGVKKLQEYVDTLIVIPNQNLFRLADEKTTFAEAFRMADDVLHSGVRGVTDLITMPGLINLDFSDIRAVMGEMGKAMMGTGEAEGEERAIKAAENAISNPLLDNSSMRGATGVLINITGGSDITLFEVDEAANRIREEVEQDARIIFGSAFDENLKNKIRVSVVATGIDPTSARKPDSNTVLHSSASATASTSATDNSASHDATKDAANRPFIAPKAIEPEDIISQLDTPPLPSANDEQAPSGHIGMRLCDVIDNDKKNNAPDASSQDEQDNRTEAKKKKMEIMDIPAFIRRKLGG